MGCRDALIVLGDKMSNRFNLILCLCLLGLAACAPKEFSPAGEGDVVLTSVDSGGDAEIVTESEPDPEPAATVYPNIEMKIPTCSANTICNVRVLLSRSDLKSISFQWKTHDTKWQENPAIYAQPDKHYVRTSGTVLYVPGDTEEQISIRSLDGFTQIRIPFQWWNCRYNDQPIDCSALQFRLTAG